MTKYKLKDCFKSRASPQSYYPLWRRPLSTISFYILWIIANLGIKNPYILSFLTIILGFIGCILISIGYLVTGSIVLVSSYIFDLLDGKLARLLNKSNKNAKFNNRIDVRITRLIFFKPSDSKNRTIIVITSASASGLYEPNNSTPAWLNCLCLPACGRSYRNIGPI